MAYLIIRPISRRIRRARLQALVLRLERLEKETRDACAAVMELTEPEDDLHVAVRLLVEALDG